MDKKIPEPGQRSNSNLDNINPERIKLVHGWISEQDCDAIVMMAPQNMESRDEIYDEIFDAAGSEFDACVLETALEPRPGDMFAVPGFKLKCRHVLVGITPVWRTEFDREDKVLSGLCRRAMEMAADMGLRSVAFPLLRGGRFGYPKKRAARLIVQGITSAAYGDIEDIRIVCDDEADLALFEALL